MRLSEDDYSIHLPQTQQHFVQFTRPTRVRRPGGKALSTGGRRDKVFLMTKVCDRDYQGAKRHLEDSLRRLKTDRIDLWQFHEVIQADLAR